MLSCPRCPVVKCVRHRGDDVCCSVVLGTLVGLFVSSVMWSELLMTSAISCPRWYVSRRCINVFNCDMFSVVYVYLDHLKFCGVCIDGRRNVCCS